MTTVVNEIPDAVRLAAYLHDHVEGFERPPTVTRLNGGQSNPTYRVEAANRVYALRAKPAPAAQLLPSAHQIEREFRVLAALAGSEVPVPKVHHLCVDESVIGRAFFLMDFVEGRTFVDPQLPELSSDERAALFADMNRVIGALHRVPWQAVGLADYGKPGDYLARQIARWARQYRASETEIIPAMDSLIEWLPTILPPNEITTLVHGDYRLDNLVIDRSEPRVVAVLDWELSTLGSPLADFAYHCCVWHFPAGLYRGLAGVATPDGIPSEELYRQAYEARSGHHAGEWWDYYLIYNFFRMAAIVQGIRKRVLEGTAAGADAAEFGRGARLLADLGWERAQRWRSTR